jgi:hypothetical protein
MKSFCLEIHSISSCGYKGLLPQEEKGWCVKLTTHLHQVPRLRIGGAILPFVQYVFMAWCFVKHRDNFLPLIHMHLKAACYVKHGYLWTVFRLLLRNPISALFVSIRFFFTGLFNDFPKSLNPGNSCSTCITLNTVASVDGSRTMKDVHKHESCSRINRFVSFLGIIILQLALLNFDTHDLTVCKRKLAFYLDGIYSEN